LADAFGNMRLTVTDRDNGSGMPKTVRVTQRTLNRRIWDESDDVQSELDIGRNRMRFLDHDTGDIRVPRGDGQEDQVFHVRNIDEENPELDEAISQYDARGARGGKTGRFTKRRSNKRRKINKGKKSRSIRRRRN
jgi:hypothetical protein